MTLHVRRRVLIKYFRYINPAGESASSRFEPKFEGMARAKIYTELENGKPVHKSVYRGQPTSKSLIVFLSQHGYSQDQNVYFSSKAIIEEPPNW